MGDDSWQEHRQPTLCFELAACRALGDASPRTRDARRRVKTITGTPRPALPRCHARYSGGWLLLPRGAIALTQAHLATGSWAGQDQVMAVGVKMIAGMTRSVLS